MGALESNTTLIYGLHLRESANDGSDFSNGATDYRVLFLGEDGLLHVKDSAGTVTNPFTGAGAVATDSIWDAAGDLAVGSGANTAAKLTIGNAGAVLARINGAVAWNASTSFPTATTGDRFFRTDLGMEFYYDGTRWLSTQIFTSRMHASVASSSTTVGDLSSTIAATASVVRAPAPSLQGGSDIWLISHRIVYQVNSGGTALSGSHKWVATFKAIDTNSSTLTTHATTNVDSGSSGVYREATTAIGAVKTSGTFWYLTTWTKTGTPGTLVTGEEFAYRIIAT